MLSTCPRLEIHLFYRRQLPEFTVALAESQQRPAFIHTHSQPVRLLTALLEAAYGLVQAATTAQDFPKPHRCFRQTSRKREHLVETDRLLHQRTGIRELTVAQVDLSQQTLSIGHTQVVVKLCVYL